MFSHSARLGPFRAGPWGCGPLSVALTLACTACSGVPPAAGEGTFTIEALRKHLAQAVSGDRREVVIPPGVYRGSIDENVFVTIEGARNLTIVAEGVTLICEKLTRALQIYGCEDLTIRGLTVDYDPLPFTQGTIVAVAPDDGWVDVKIHQGYPVAAYSRIDLVDPQTRHRKHGMPFLWGTTAELRPGGIVRVARKGGFGAAAAVGDLASMSTGQEAGGICHGISIERCARVSLRDVTLHAAPGFGIINGGGYGDHHYDNVRVVPGPRPPGATEDRLLTTSWDALQFNNLRKGPTVENCTVEAAGDDSWSLSSRDYLLLASEGRNAWLVHRVPYQSPLEIGDRLARSLDSPEPRIVKMTAVAADDCPMTQELRANIESAKPWTYYHFKLENIREVELDMDCPWEPGTSLYSPDRNCSGFVLRNNTFHSSGRAGLINGASRGLIEGNTYIDVYAALSIYPNIPADGGTGAEDIVFRSNVVRGTGHFCPAPWSLGGGAVVIHHTASGQQPAPAGVYRGIVIENNTFENIRGPVFVVTSTDGLRITGNRLVGCQHLPYLGSGRDWGVDGEALGWFANNRNVTLRDNEVKDRGRYGTHGFVGLPAAQPELDEDATPSGTLYDTRVRARTAPLVAECSYRLWVPDDTQAIRAVFAINMRAAGRHLFYRDPEWRALAARTGSAMMYCEFEAKEVRESGYGQSMLEACNQFADELDHPELKHAPFVLWGHSMGGRVAQDFARFRPARVLAFHLALRKLPSPPEFMKEEAESMQIPALYLMGEEDGKPTDIRNHFRRSRNNGSPRAWVWLPGQGHWPKGMNFEVDETTVDAWRAWAANDVVIPWTEAMIRLRLPETPGPIGAPVQLCPVDTTQGWLGNIETGEIAPYGAYAGQKQDASWFPREDVARAWTRFAFPAQR